MIAATMSTRPVARTGCPPGEPLYLDHNATTPPCSQAVAEMLDVLQRAWANPSSIHAGGQLARSVLSDARLRVARFLGCSTAELMFTSGATESNHTAVLGALAARESARTRTDAGPGAGLGLERRQWVLSAVEHPGLMALAAQLRSHGTPVDIAPVDSQGRLDMQALRALVGPQTALVSVMAANNETGVRMPIAELAALVAERGAWLHVDATQWVGKLPMDFSLSGAHLMSASAHKLGGPKGVGVLLVRKGIALPALMPGRQERHRRGGTENLPGIAGFAAACDAVAVTLGDEARRQEALRERLERGLRTAMPQVRVLGHEAPRLPNTLCVCFGSLHAEIVLTRLERAGILASSGAACSAGGNQPSHVMLAMGLTPEQAQCSVRLSLGPATADLDIERAIRDITAALRPLLGTALFTSSSARSGAPSTEGTT
jgi:cysteine desulfurase